MFIPTTEDGKTHYQGIPLAINFFTEAPGYSIFVFEPEDEA